MINVATCMSSLPEAFTTFDEWENIYPNTGIYVRGANYKAGDMILGKPHHNWDVTILCSGELIFMGDIHGEQVRLQAPKVFETPPGSQKIGKALTDITVMNIITIRPGETIQEVNKRIASTQEVPK